MCWRSTSVLSIGIAPQRSIGVAQLVVARRRRVAEALEARQQQAKLCRAHDLARLEATLATQFGELTLQCGVVRCEAGHQGEQAIQIAGLDQSSCLLERSRDARRFVASRHLGIAHHRWVPASPSRSCWQGQSTRVRPTAACGWSLALGYGLSSPRACIGGSHLLEARPRTKVIPSSNIESSCTSISTHRASGPTSRSEENVPRSNRLCMIVKPPRVHTSSFTWLRRRFRNTRM